MSDKDKADIARDIVIADIKRRKAAGTLYDNIHGEEKPQKISFPASFEPINSNFDNSRSASAGVPVGNVECFINTQFPHAGSGPGGSTVVKAKSSGDCVFNPNGLPTPPPTITWNLLQVIVDLNGFGFFTATASHARTSLNPVWSASSTQVFDDQCINSLYSHYDLMFVVPPPGWTYTGPQPIILPGAVENDIHEC